MGDLASHKMAWLVEPTCRDSCQSADFVGASYSSFKAPDPTEQIIFWTHSCNFKDMGTGNHNASTSRLGRPKPEKHFLSLLIQLLQRSLAEPAAPGSGKAFLLYYGLRKQWQWRWIFYVLQMHFRARSVSIPSACLSLLYAATACAQSRLKHA